MSIETSANATVADMPSRPRFRDWMMLGFAAVVVIAGGLFQGVRTGRWLLPTSIQDALVDLSAIPREIGDWRGTDLSIDPRLLAQSNVQTFLARRYVRSSDGAWAEIVIVGGLTRDIAVHTPDVCFAGAGQERLDPLSKRTLVRPIGTGAGVGADAGVVTDTFWTTRFQQPPPGGVTRVDWAFRPGGLGPQHIPNGPWSAPADARWEFAGSLILYKMYVLRDDNPSSAADDLIADLASR